MTKKKQNTNFKERNSLKCHLTQVWRNITVASAIYNFHWREMSLCPIHMADELCLATNTTKLLGLQMKFFTIIQIGTRMRSQVTWLRRHQHQPKQTHVNPNGRTVPFTQTLTEEQHGSIFSLGILYHSHMDSNAQIHFLDYTHSCIGQMWLYSVWLNFPTYPTMVRWVYKITIWYERQKMIYLNLTGWNLQHWGHNITDFPLTLTDLLPQALASYYIETSPPENPCIHLDTPFLPVIL